MSLFPNEKKTILQSVVIISFISLNLSGLQCQSTLKIDNHYLLCALRGKKI